jgi:hypothetical protein
MCVACLAFRRILLEPIPAHESALLEAGKSAAM